MVSESAANGFGRKVRRCIVGWQRRRETWESGRIALSVAMMRRGMRGEGWKRSQKCCHLGIIIVGILKHNTTISKSSIIFRAKLCGSMKSCQGPRQAMQFWG